METKRMTDCLALCAVISASLAAAAGVVEVPDCAEPSTLLARDEFTNYVCRITGRVDACPDTVIGTVKTLGGRIPADAAKALAKTENIEAAWTGFDGRTLWIVGKNEVAELYAVYHFLESRLGVRWFQAKTKEDPGDYVPKAQRIELKPFEEFREPKFRIRMLEAMHCYGNLPATNAQTCAVRNGFQVNAPYGRINYERPDEPNTRFYAPRTPHKLTNLGGDHLTFAGTCPAKKWFATHPEYFALLGGERKPGRQYCISNPGLRQAVVDRIVAALDRDGGNGQWVFGMWDTSWGWCECDACRALDDPREQAGEMPNVARRFAITVNDMAAKVWAKYPKADLRMWAYHTYRKRAMDVAIDPRMKICFCDHGRCYAHAIDDPTCVRNAGIFAMLKDWMATGNQVYVYAYLLCTDPLYTCNEMMQADDIRKYVKLGVMGWKEEGSYSDARFVNQKATHLRDIQPSNWQWCYVTSHMMWDPTLDEMALVDDAESKYYGAAYPAMREYQALRRKLWAEGRGCMGYPRGDQRRPQLLDAPGAKERLLALLDQADRLACGDDVLKFRLARDRRWLETYWIEPNERFKKKMSKAIYVPRTAKKVMIDGVADEDAWNDAFTVPQDLMLNIRDRSPMDAAFKTTVKTMCDGDNLYFLMTAFEPEMSKVKMHSNRGDIVWGDDSMEVILFPPSIENVYYQLGMTPAGGMCAEKSGQKAPGEFGAEHAGRMHPDRYVMELRVPVKGMYPLADGEVWRVNLCRSRVLRDEFAHREEHYSIGGVGFLSTSEYHPLVIGAKK